MLAAASDDQVATNAAAQRRSTPAHPPHEPQTIPIELVHAVVAAGTAVVGVATEIYSYFRSNQHEYIAATDPPERRGQCWIIATEEGWGNVRICRYDHEEDARREFDRIKCSRILYNRQEREVASNGVNAPAIARVRAVMRETYFQSPSTLQIE